MRKLPRVMIPLVDIAGASFATWTAYSAPPPQPPPPPVEPPRAPYPTTVGGAAIVEPAAERTTALGAPYAGLVTDVYHRAGERVAKDEPLFRLDDRPLRADRVVLEAQLVASQAKLDRLLALPRAEDIPPTEARVASAKASVEDRRSALERLERAAAAGHGAIPADEVDRARWALVVAEKNVATAEADLVRLCLPRRVYTQSHVDWVVETFAQVVRDRARLRGLRIEEQPRYLRAFTAKLRPVAAAVGGTSERSRH